ncbi:hypothetical protein KC19_7G149900 [Ceratodon purpureus]|uniref:TF-B3 domain-containing protein n=1 Tax=Ceratodon purpureus TaxID=3225 RepID=A0A8T0H898_CERPU|nr:hypothetical protein KC19_7G149900 [Ceratodon purpureus]
MASQNSGEVEDDAHDMIIRELDACRAFYFATEILLATDLHRLEIPKSFNAKCGWPGHLNYAMVTSITAKKQWPLQLKRFEHGLKKFAFSIGEGWPEFVADNHIGLRDLFVFEVVDDTCLVVRIHRHRHRPATSGKKKLKAEATPSEIPPTPKPCSRPATLGKKKMKAEATPSEISPAPKPEQNPVEVPLFCKTLRISHLKSRGATRLDIPTLYWRTYGTEQFDGHFFTLGGPLNERVVKNVLLMTTKQTFCFFTSGWLEFCKRNELKVGDTLLFAKTGPSSFEVSKKILGKFLYV